MHTFVNVFSLTCSGPRKCYAGDPRPPPPSDAGLCLHSFRGSCALGCGSSRLAPPPSLIWQSSGDQNKKRSLACMDVCVRACKCACMRASVRVHACAHMCVCVCLLRPAVYQCLHSPAASLITTSASKMRLQYDRNNGREPTNTKPTNTNRQRGSQHRHMHPSPHTHTRSCL